MRVGRVPDRDEACAVVPVRSPPGSGLGYIASPMDPRSAFAQIFGAPRALIGMVHVGALPGSPAAHHPVDRLVQLAVAEARVYRDAGFTAIAIENMHDRPYLKGGVGPEVTAAMTAIGHEIKRETGLPLGVQVLAGANREAIAVAHACGAEFVRVEGFVYAHVADEGLFQAAAGELLRYRRAIGAERVRVRGLEEEHASHAITADVSLAETARAAEFFLADGVIVTGTATGAPTEASDLHDMRSATRLPVLVGSGLTSTNLATYAAADGFIVGSSLKQGGLWSQPLDTAAVRAMAVVFAALPPRAV
jgi:membrane complex biogenesis BtpA family protein